jgi:hypothetical protein
VGSLESASRTAMSYVALSQTVTYRVILTANYSIRRAHLEISDGRNGISAEDDGLY